MSRSHHQSQDEVPTNSPSQDYMYPHGYSHTSQTYDKTPGFKPFTTHIIWNYKNVHMHSKAE